MRKLFIFIFFACLLVMSTLSIFYGCFETNDSKLIHNCQIFNLTANFFSSFICITYSNVYAQNPIYARVMFNGALLYKTTSGSNSMSNIYFIIPQTYFVELIDSADEYYLVKYFEFTGYVKQDMVQAVKSYPSKPNLDDVCFRIYAEPSCNMFAEPSAKDQSKLITHIPLYSQNIQYIASTKGDCLIEGRTDVWYYCKYTDTESYYGYVYSDFCDKMTNLSLNDESVEYTQNPSFEKSTEQTSTLTMENKIVPIIVFVLSVPAFIFIFLIIKGKNLVYNEKTNSKEIVDY